MFVFYLLLFAPILIQHIAIKGVCYEKKNRYTLTLFFVILTALIMLRHESVGKDTRNYIYYFKKFASLEWGTLFSESSEFGFVFYNKLISVFTESPQIFLSVTALITVAMIYPTYRRLCCDASLTIVLFVNMSIFVMMFSGIRQMLAIGMGVLAYEATRKRKLRCFIAIVLAAMMFHASAFMLFAMYPLYHCKMTKKRLYAVAVILAMVFLLKSQIFQIAMRILMKFTRFDIASSDTGAYTMLILFAALAFFSYWIPDESKLDEETKGLRNILLFAVMIQIFAPLHTLAMRMNYYYIIFIPILIPMVLKARKDELRQVAVVARWGMVLFFLTYFLITLDPLKTLNVFRYHFFWESGV